MRLAALEVRDGRAWIEIEVRPSPALEALAPVWSGARICIGSHWLDRRGAMLAFEGARSDPLDLDLLELAPVRRRLSLDHRRPDGGERVQIDLVAEGLAWGHQAGLGMLELQRPRGPAMRAARPAAVGPSPPDEASATTREWLAAAWPRDAAEAEMADYVGADLARFLMSVQLVPDPGRTLEIGANPYFITRLLAARHPDADLTLTNFFGTGEAAIDQEVVDAGGTVVGVFHSDLVDVETQPLPYPDGRFDTVLLCEVIEHMVSDPVFVLREIHRVLAPRGRLLLTTPNVARAANLHRLAQRQGVYDPYSSYGPHGRHNREYVAEELHEMLVRNGFRIERYLTRPVHDVPDPGPEWFAAADDDGAGDYHFVVAARVVATEPFRPGWLYR